MNIFSDKYEANQKFESFRQWGFGFNYRMPNLNAALGCAQMETLVQNLKQKRILAGLYEELFIGSDYRFVTEPDYAESNYWLNALICTDTKARDDLIERTNSKGVMTRPVWQLMHRLPMYRNNFRSGLENSEWVADRLINIPSSVPKMDVANA